MKFVGILFLFIYLLNLPFLSFAEVNILIAKQKNPPKNETKLQQSDKTKKIAEYIKKGKELKAKGKKNEAMDAFKSVIALDNTYAEAYYNLGLILLDLANFSSAVNIMEKAVKYAPDNNIYQYYLATAYYGFILENKSINTAYIDKATPILEKLLEIRFKEKDIAPKLGHLYILKEKYDKAIQILSLCINQFKIDNAEIRYLLGTAYFRVAYALPDIQKNILLTEKENNKRFLKWDFYNKALNEYKIALKKDSNYTIIYYNIGSIYYYKSLIYPVADLVINEVTEQNALDYYKEGIKFFKKDMAKSAIFNFEKYLSLEPQTKGLKEIKNLVNELKKIK